MSNLPATSKKRGPKPTVVDFKEFEKLCEMQCTQEEVAGWFNCSVDSLERWAIREHNVKFADLFHQKRKNGHKSLRRAQWETAVYDKVPSLLIWLGKQYLGQSDKHESSNNDKVTIVIDKDDAKL